MQGSSITTHMAAVRVRTGTSLQASRGRANRLTGAGQTRVSSLLLCIALFAELSASLETGIGVKVSKSVFELKGLNHVIAVLCNDADAVLWERAFAVQGNSLISTARGSAAFEVLRTAKTAVGVFLQVGCWDARRLLQQSSAAALFGGNHHWVLAGNASTLRAELLRVAEDLELAVDSEVTLAALAPGTRTVHLVDAYRVAPGRPLLTQLTATWTEATGITHFLSGSTATRRRDLQGIVLRAGVLVDGFRETELARVLGKPKDNNPLVSPVAAFSQILAVHLQDLLNFQLRLQSGTFYRLLDRLARRELDLVTTVMDMQAKYWDILDYTTVPLWTERSVMVLKNPSAMWSYDAWTRPLDGNVWLILVVVIMSTAAVLRAVGYWEVRLVEGHAEEEDTWAAAVTTALSMACAQGFTTTTNWASGRAMLLVFEFFSLFMNLFYSSGIVTFLLTFPPPFAHTVREIIDSPFIVGVDKSVLGVSNFTESRDDQIRELYESKIAEEADGGGFVDLQTAGERAREERFAFIGEPFSMYDMMALTWSQSDICRIQEIQLMPSGLLAFATAKRSPFREILNQGILMLVERGLPARERLRWSVRRPRCALGDVTELDNVALRPVSPVLAILALGLALSLVFLSLELASTKCGNRKAVVVDLLKDVTDKGLDAIKKAA